MNAFKKAFSAKLKRLQRQGISINVSPGIDYNTKQPSKEVHFGTATDKKGNEIARVSFLNGVPHGTIVDPKHRRKGIASAMYSQYENVSGTKLKPDVNQTSEAKQLWAQKGRPFGKHEAELRELLKSPYGPQGMGLYSQNDNARRKMGRTSDEVAVGPNKAVHATSVSAKQSAAALAAADKARSKKNPVRTFSQAEINKLMRSGFKLPKAPKVL